VVGHSSGGQFVQRWGLLTPIEGVRVVVANPSSYAYPWDKRFDRHDWIIPPTDDDCPLYNSWGWGLDLSQDFVAPLYVTKILQESNSTEWILQRFAQRDMVYLAGGLDRCNVSKYEINGWCFSNGLETTCMDNWQGPDRLLRHYNYLAAIALRLPSNRHRHAIVPGVGHDHSLMFHSLVGRSYILGEHESVVAAN